MYGSFLYNSWAALIGFTIYFVLALQTDFPLPLPTLLGSFIAAVVLFVVMYPVRYLLGYVLFTPELVQLEEQEVLATPQEDPSLDLPSLEQAKKVEFEDDSAEEVAQVVRTMMYQEQQSV